MAVHPVTEKKHNGHLVPAGEQSVIYVFSIRSKIFYRPDGPKRGPHENEF